MSLKFTGELYVMTMKNDAKIEKELTCQLKLTRGIWQMLTQVLKYLKNWHFNGLLLTKVDNVWAKKKYGGVMFDGTEDWCKIWSKTDLPFLKRHEESGKLSFTG